MNSGFYKETFMKISEEKRQRILDAAIAEFSEHGFDSANINTIAQRSDVSVGSLYKYFENKENLFLAIVHVCVEKLKAVLEDIIKSDEKLESRIEKIIKAIQVHTRENVHLTKLYNEMTTENRSSLVWKIVSDMENATAGLYASMIKEAKEAGYIRSDINENLFAFYLDNLFIMLQFSYACEYYKERMKIFVGEDVVNRDELVAEQLMKFIKDAFFLK